MLDWKLFTNFLMRNKDEILIQLKNDYGELEYYILIGFFAYNFDYKQLTLPVLRVKDGKFYLYVICEKMFIEEYENGNRTEEEKEKFYQFLDDIEYWIKNNMVDMIASPESIKIIREYGDCLMEMEITIDEANLISCHIDKVIKVYNIVKLNNFLDDYYEKR